MAVLGIMFGEAASAVSALMVVTLIFAVYRGLTSGRGTRPCPRCGRRVENGVLECSRCGFDFRAVGTTEAPVVSGGAPHPGH